MTWIVGKQFIPGYVVLFSDIQVTWQHGNINRDCLKKVYPIADNLVAGFSGSVDIGFALLEDLQSYVTQKAKTRRELAPRAIANNWYRRASRVYKSQKQEHQNLGCSIIMGSVSKSESKDRTELPRTDIVLFKSQNRFEPQHVPFLKSASIGSGNNVDAYCRFLEDSDKMDSFASLSSGDFEIGRAGETFAYLASIMIQKNRVPRVSQHLHCTLVSRFGWKQFPCDFNTYGISDQEIETKMPNVIESYEEFRKFKHWEAPGLGAATA